MRNMMIAFVLAVAGTQSAADIAWNVKELTTGSVMVMQDRLGATAHVKRDSYDDLHQFDVFAGTGADAAYLGSYKVNNRGDIVETAAIDGAVTRYAPHRCNRSVGTCHFTVIHSDGFREARSRVTEETRKGLRYWEYGLDGLMTEGALTLDANGTAQNGWKRAAGQPKLKSRRVSLALR
jgi:hypothetical protein